MHALVRFAHIASGDTFTMRDLHPAAAAALDTTTDRYRLASLRYDLSKLRAKGLVERVPHCRRYRLRPQGYTICVVLLKLFERVYAPLTAGLLRPLAADARLAEDKRHQLDRLTNASSRTLRRSCASLDSRSLLEHHTQRVQNSHKRPHNGLCTIQGRQQAKKVQLNRTGSRKLAMTKDISSRALRVDGLRIHYLTAGAGPAVVLLAGFPQTSDAWRKVIPGLAEHFVVYAVDLPGLGYSDKPTDGYDTNSAAKRLHTALQALGLDRLHLVGHDVGAWVAIPYAAMFPSEVTRLVVMEGGIPGVAGVRPIPADPVAWQRNAHFLFHLLPDIPEMLISGREEQYVAWFITRQLANPTAIGAEELAAYARVYAAPGALRAALGYYREVFTDAEQNLELLTTKLPMPVLALDGAGKPNPLVEALVPYTVNLRGGYIEGSGHFIPEEQPQRLLAELLAFFAET